MGKMSRRSSTRPAKPAENKPALSRVAFDIETDLHRHLKHTAIDLGMTDREALTEAIRAFIAKHERG